VSELDAMGNASMWTGV